MANAKATAPNRAAPIGANLGTSGKRKNVARVGGSASSSDRGVNTKSSNNTPNLSAQNQKRN